MIRLILPLLLVLSACAVPAPPPAPGPTSQLPPGAPPSARQAADNFVAVVDRVEPIAEQVCRERTRGVDCDFQIAVDSRPNQPPNAFQTLNDAGRPVIGFTVALIADARNQDELAFILGHEAAHHIEGHIPRVQASAMQGALLAGALATLGGANAATAEQVSRLGAQVGARSFAKDFELEADALGTVIAYQAGYDPARGAEYFTRIPDPGNRFLGTHPPNGDRVATVQRVLSQIR
ncbi:M48 family metallopeptidase [Anianabacter salinae]|uniref:M48 family metallopeptidase n=1 Tax=Anianabacter salinae TaxID=2851023 RepID=UPI00225E2D06|nr:M48 family metallopeptidase [Anianabacter salinae]MBV0912644.1 M48 family metallopeptidase [Anianabacter salinae]